MEICLGVKKALLRFREFLFKEEVRSFLHVQAAVGLLGDEIIFFDIEPESADVSLPCSVSPPALLLSEGSCESLPVTSLESVVTD